MRVTSRPQVFSREIRHIHCVGVGGMGVGPLAIYLRGLGFVVTGEDDGLTEEMAAWLARAGVGVGPIPAECELVVYSSAIAATHPAYVAATTRGLPLVRRGEMLAEIVRGKKLVAVCGSHGKTTTTAMLITALRRANFPAGYVLGGLFNNDTPPAGAGENDWVVAEIDESDGTIARFSPELTVAVNLDWDHPDHYRRREDLEATFRALFERTRGTVLTSAACAMSAGVTQGLGRVVTFGETGEFSGVVASEAAGRMHLRLGGKFSAGEAVVQAGGAFNAANATAALAAAQLMGATPRVDLLADYPGVRRRQGVIGVEEGVTVLEDYAHHPAEIRALLGSLRKRLGGEGGAAQSGRLVVVFQPHRFSRTAQFKAEFASALGLAERLFLLEVYAAGEAPIAGGTSADVFGEVRRSGAGLAAQLVSEDDALFSALDGEVRAGDLVAFVGAGDIDRKARTWLERRRGQLAATRWDGLAADWRTALSAETKLRREEPLAPKTTMRVGGAARIYAEPATVADLQTLVRGAATVEVKVFLLGRGSNLLVPDEGVDGLVISLAHPAWATFAPRENGRVWVGAGLRLKNLCGLATKAGLVGFEFLEGIPGNVGGALRMNAGAMGGWMFDVVEQVQVMTAAGEVKLLERAAMNVSYRHCAELHDCIALGALLRPVATGDAESVSRQIDVYRRKRQESQPREPSAGCIFKNPPGNSAGRLIDESGLKGTRVGDAEVSPVHANFIVNRGEATAAEVLELVRCLRARVKAAKGVDLEPEVLLYGKEWRDVL